MTLNGLDGPPLSSSNAVSRATCSSTDVPEIQRERPLPRPTLAAVSALTSALAAINGVTRDSGKSDAGRTIDAIRTSPSSAAVAHQRRTSQHSIADRVTSNVERVPPASLPGSMTSEGLSLSAIEKPEVRQFAARPFHDPPRRVLNYSFSVRPA